MLAFVGAITSCDPVGQLMRKVRMSISIDRIGLFVNCCDVILFRTCSSMSSLQRMATGSEFDHVGVVVFDRKTDRKLLLESTVEGVTAFPLVPRLKAYNNFAVSKYIVVRQYNGKRGITMLAKMFNFLDQVVGLPYGFNLSKLVAGLLGHQSGSSSNAGSREEVDGDDNDESEETLIKDSKTKSYFCSEIVAALLRSCGVLPHQTVPSRFWPGSFSRGKELDTICPSYGKWMI